MADQLCTTAQVKARAGIADATDDTLISELIDGVSDWVQDRARRKLVPEVGAVYTFDVAAGSILYIRRGIRAITTLETAQADQPDSGGTYVTLAASAFVLRPVAAERRVGWPPDTVMVLGSSPYWRSPVINGARITGNY